MLDIFKNKEQKKEFVSTYQNPFKSDKVKKIWFIIENSYWTDHKTSYSSNIDFATGSTTGCHKIKADSFTELVAKTEAFIESL